MSGLMGVGKVRFPKRMKFQVGLMDQRVIRKTSSKTMTTMLYLTHLILSPSNLKNMYPTVLIFYSFDPTDPTPLRSPRDRFWTVEEGDP